MDKNKDIVIAGSATIREALAKLCANKKRILFVVDGGVLKGALADGDIRRFLLKGGDLGASVIEATNRRPKFLANTERRNAESFLRENDIVAVPVVDDDMVLEDVVFLADNVNLDDARIRPLEKSDLKMVMEFFDQMAGDTRAMFNRGDVNRIRVMEHLSRKDLDNEIHFAAVVKEPDGTDKMVGYVFLWDIDTLVPWLGICVREDWKGHHMGRRLLDHIDHYLKPKGFGGVMLTSVPANVRAHSLYTRMGFEYYGVYPDSEFLYIKRYGVKENQK